MKFNNRLIIYLLFYIISWPWNFIWIYAIKNSRLGWKSMPKIFWFNFNIWDVLCRPWRLLWLLRKSWLHWKLCSFSVLMIKRWKCRKSK